MTQTAIDYTKIEKEKGIKKAIDHANAVSPNWSDRAYDLLKIYVGGKQEKFLAEDFRAAIKGQIEDPPSSRAYGGVIAKAAHAGLIRKVGHATVKSVTAHNCLATLWLSTSNSNH
jgi:hypothetical protein